MITNKIKSLLALGGENLTSYANKLGTSKQSLNKKVQNETYKIQDLIHLADLTGTTLAFLDEKGDPVVKFDISDIKKG